MRARVSVAVNASELRIVGRNLVAVGADRTMVRNREPSVVEGCSCPRGRRMAGVACCRVIGSDVVRDRTAQGLCTEPVSGVAPVACGVRRGQRIVVAGVAQVAGRRQVSASEGPTG